MSGPHLDSSGPPLKLYPLSIIPRQNTFSMNTAGVASQCFLEVRQTSYFPGTASGTFIMPLETGRGFQAVISRGVTTSLKTQAWGETASKGSEERYHGKQHGEPHRKPRTNCHISDMQQNTGTFMPAGALRPQRTNSAMTLLITGCSISSSEPAISYESPGLSSAEIREWKFWRGSRHH